MSGPDLHAAIAGVVATHLPAAQAWVVGSEATGCAQPGSDIDIAVEGGGLLPLETLTRLRDALEALPTLRSFDLIDLRRATARFRQEALSQAIPLRLDAPAPHDVES